MVIIVHLVQVERLEHVGKHKADGHKSGENHSHNENERLVAHFVAFPGHSGWFEG